MSQCQHFETAPGSEIWICPTCNHKALTTHAPKRECGRREPQQPQQRQIATRTAPRAADEAKRLGPCVHRGDVVAKDLVCKLCGLKGETYDVFECVKHGKCALKKREHGLQSCLGCGDHQPPGPRPGGPLKVVLIAPALHNPGGIERWLVAMSRYLPLASAGRVVVSHVVIKFPDAVDPDMLAELSQVTHVQVYRHDETSQRATLAVINSGDVAVVSGMGDVTWCINGFRGPVVWLSHSCCRYSEQFSREAMASGLVTNWASVGHLAKGVFPDELLDVVTAIENGAEIDRCTPTRGRAWQREQWGLAEDQIAVGFVGRLCDEKRPIALAEAIAQLPPEYVGIMIGSGIHEKQTREACAKIVGDRVRFVGRINPLGDALAALDLGFLASNAEGFCLSRSEMQLAGLPMASTPTGELPRLEAEHGSLAWSIPIGATGPEMAGVIQRAMRDRETTQEIANRAKALAWQRYTGSAMAGRWVDYFDSIIKPHE